MWKVYSAKTVYRTEVIGPPIVQDEEYSDKFDMIEERIVTIKAVSIEDAIVRAEKEANEYAQGEYINPYGQEYIWRYIGSINVYDPFDNLPAGLEVYSDTYLIEKAMSDDELTDNIFGKEIDNQDKFRVNFLNSEIVGFR